MQKAAVSSPGDLSFKAQSPAAGDQGYKEVRRAHVLTQYFQASYHIDVCYTALWLTVVKYNLVMGREKIPL